ncbi:MAG: Skp family chaperone for outer membrane protein [Neolewinella sp.]|jgi:Skp family chaperone for outer membrane proteins
MNMLTRILPTFILVATALVFFSCQQQETATGAEASTTTAAATSGSGPSIVYVRLDSLQLGYGALAVELERLEGNVQKAQENIQSEMASLQREVQQLQNKAQQGLLTPNKIQSEQQRIGQKEQRIMQQRDVATASIQEDQMRLQQQFGERLKAILEAMQEENGYDFILNEGGGGGLLMASDAYDITEDVLKRLNAEEGDAVMAKDSLQ